VNYALVGNHVLLRIDGDGLGRRLDGQVVAFEVDEIDAVVTTGWSVVVTGTARLLRDAGELMRQDAFPLGSATGADCDARVWIVPGEITGRQIRSAYDAA
jgi:hypothetical protein